MDHCIVLEHSDPLHSVAVDVGAFPADRFRIRIRYGTIQPLLEHGYYGDLWGIEGIWGAAKKYIRLLC